jgi:uncharacterized protein (DUF2267 family)
MRRLSVDPDRAEELVRQVGRALAQSISAGEIADVSAQLPPDMKRVFAPAPAPEPSPAR